MSRRSRITGHTAIGIAMPSVNTDRAMVTGLTARAASGDEAIRGAMATLAPTTRTSRASGCSRGTYMAAVMPNVSNAANHVTVGRFSRGNQRPSRASSAKMTPNTNRLPAGAIHHACTP